MKQVDVMPPGIVLSFPDYIPDIFIEEARAEFSSDAFTLPDSFINVRKVERHAYAALEWTIPTAIAVYIGKSVFDALMKEVAKEYAPSLVAGIKALAKRCQQMHSRFVTATGSTHKVNANYCQSSAFSVTVQTKNGRHIKVLFDEGLKASDWEDAIDGILGTVATNYLYAPEDDLSKAPLMQLTKDGAPLYVLYSRERKAWELHNDQTLVAQAREQKAGE